MVQSGCRDSGHHDCIPTITKKVGKSSLLVFKKLNRFYWPETLLFTFRRPVPHHMATHSHTGVQEGQSHRRGPSNYQGPLPPRVSPTVSALCFPLGFRRDFVAADGRRPGGTLGETSSRNPAFQELACLCLRLCVSGLLVKFRAEWSNLNSASIPAIIPRLEKRTPYAEWGIT